MMSEPKGKKPGHGSSGMPEPPENGNYSDFVSVDEVKAKGDKFVLLGTSHTYESKFGDGVILDIRHGGKQKAWRVRFESTNYRLLFDRFGKNEKRWKGPVKVCAKDYNGNAYIAVV